MTQSIRVLLVEDNPGDADLTRETLEQSKLLVDIQHAVDGDQALDLLLGRRGPRIDPLPDLLLLDLNLPKVSGAEVLEAMRKDPALRHIPVVILTSSDAEAEITRCYALGANCYVTKPVGLKAFQDIVQSVEQFWFTVVRLP